MQVAHSEKAGCSACQRKDREAPEDAEEDAEHYDVEPPAVRLDLGARNECLGFRHPRNGPVLGFTSLLAELVEDTQIDGVLE